MSILPAGRPRLTESEARAAFDRGLRTLRQHGDLTDADMMSIGGQSVRVLAIRGYYLNTMGVRAANDRGIYDDALIVISPSTFSRFNGNTDPSRVRRGEGTGSKKGMACVKAPQLLWYRPGMHWGSIPHRAFRQDDEITIVRDGSPNYEQHGMFGINLHRGGRTRTSSLGCQTVPPQQWDSFRSLLEGELKRHHQERFPYLLIESSSL